MRLAAYQLLRVDGGEPVLLLDDVFAELDVMRPSSVWRRRPSPPNRCWVTAAVLEDIPAGLGRQAVHIDVRADDTGSMSVVLP